VRRDADVIAIITPVEKIGSRNPRQFTRAREVLAGERPRRGTKVLSLPDLHHRSAF